MEIKPLFYICSIFYMYENIWISDQTVSLNVQLKNQMANRSVKRNTKNDLTVFSMKFGIP